jgi:hypothetical protein
MTSKNTLAMAVATLFLSLFSACSGGGGGGGGGVVAPASKVSGSWYGTEEQSNGNLASLSVAVDANNNITSVEIDGVPQGLTGAVTLVPGQTQIYSFTLSDGSEGGFFMDSTSTYIVFLDEDFNFGVLQKGAVSLPNAGPADIFGKNFTGITVTLDANFDLSAVVASQAQVFANGAFQGSEGNGTVFANSGGGELAQFSSLYGAWVGQFSSNGPSGNSNGQVRAFVSPDKQFIGTWACDSGGAFPEDCSFAVWRAL